jgi:Coenzyme PQQ synthesis protein D (PqqD)
MILNTNFQINISKVVNETIDGETVIINLDRGYYYSLNNVGSDIWKLIESNGRVSEIITGILQRYQGNRTQIEEAVVKFIELLQQEELIVPNSTEETASATNMVESVFEGEVTDFEMPAFEKYTDMQDLLLLDPIHEVDETGWPAKKAGVVV